MTTGEEMSGSPRVATLRGEKERQVTVFAAGSLKESFEDLGRRFTAKHPRMRIMFHFAAVPFLLAELEQGAVADIFASADLLHLQKAGEAGLLAGEPLVFARNHLAIAVPKHNPAQIRTLTDLVRPGVRIVLEREDLPAGRYAREILGKASQQSGYGSDFAARVLANVVAEEVNVKQVVARVARGEADAGFVYVTDVQAAGGAVAGITIPEELSVTAWYSIGILASADEPELAREFVALVLSDEGQAVLEKYGFLSVPAV